jgi:hypothetical protein
MNRECVDMKRVQEEIYRTRPDLAPYGTLFSLLRKHRLGRLAYNFMNAGEPELPRHDENVMTMSHLRPGRKFLAGPECKPILLNQCGCCKKFKQGIEAEYCVPRNQGGSALYACRACTRYRTCAICDRKRCVCRFVKCCVEDCPNLMCRCRIFGESEEEDDDAPEYFGCAFLLDPDDDDSSEGEQMQYCREHKPDGAARWEFVDAGRAAFGEIARRVW